MFDIVKEVSEIEAMSGGILPGTALSRVLSEKGLGWCLAVGMLSTPKEFFYAEDIPGCFKKAKAFYKKLRKENN